MKVNCLCELFLSDGKGVSVSWEGSEREIGENEGEGGRGGVGGEGGEGERSTNDEKHGEKAGRSVGLAKETPRNRKKKGSEARRRICREQWHGGQGVVRRKRERDSGRG